MTRRPMPNRWHDTDEDLFESRGPISYVDPEDDMPHSPSFQLHVERQYRKHLGDEPAVRLPQGGSRTSYDPKPVAAVDRPLSPAGDVCSWLAFVWDRPAQWSDLPKTLADCRRCIDDTADHLRSQGRWNEYLDHAYITLTFHERKLALDSNHESVRGRWDDEQQAEYDAAQAQVAK